MTARQLEDERIVWWVTAHPGVAVGGVCTAIHRLYRVKHDSTYRRVFRLIRSGRLAGLAGRRRTTVTVVQ